MWQTSNFESWQLAANVEPPERSGTPANGPGASLSVASRPLATRLYAAGQFAYRSDDGGLNWTNLTQRARIRSLAVL